MNKRALTILIRWLNRNQTRVKITEQLLFEEAYWWHAHAKNDWRVRQCIIAYSERGIVPDFVTAFVRSRLYPELLIGESHAEVAA